MAEHSEPRQYPNTPKSTPPSDASGIPRIMGVERTDISRRANAANSNTERGVAGLNILSDAGSAYGREGRRRQDAAL